LGAQDVESLLENQIRIVTGKRRDLEILEDNSSSSDVESRGGEELLTDHHKMPAQKTAAQEQPLNHSVTSTGM